MAAALISLHLQTATEGMMTAFGQYFDEGLRRGRPASG